jgi:ubiquinone/menaquinone biosynthesis C-methylase UbiE
MPLTNQFLTKENLGKEFIEDIEISHCSNCGLTQNPNDFDFQKYYNDYDYTAGHSQFARNFMQSFSSQVYEIYKQCFGRPPKSVIEVGSGDGTQLKFFKDIFDMEVLGFEPSKLLAHSAELNGISTVQEYFDENTRLLRLASKKFDVSISSYTLDHMPQPKKFLRELWRCLSEESLLVFEIHDLSTLSKRGEWCLLEHEHLVYSDKNFWKDKLGEVGFEIVSINFLSEDLVRANSLIIAAKRKSKFLASDATPQVSLDIEKILKAKQNLQTFVDLQGGQNLIGWGLGGRGVMTAAFLSNSSKFLGFMDSNINRRGLYLPKTHIPILPISDLGLYKNKQFLVFSFGYFDEISKVLITSGVDASNIYSFGDFL